MLQAVDRNFHYTPDKEVLAAKYTQVFAEKVTVQTECRIRLLFQRTGPRIGGKRCKIKHACVRLVA